MRQFFLVLALLIMLYGCSNINTNLEYRGDFLDIGVVGNSQLPEFVNIEYIKLELNYLVENDAEYDALIITQDAFSEADKDKYVSFFNEIQYPVFFIGLEGYQAFAFTRKGITLDMARVENSAYVQGFKNANTKESQKWRFYLPETNKHKDTDKEMLLRIFEVLN